MSQPGPLSGVTVVDLTRVLAGPFCTLVLADLGARVIKIETPGSGDDTRGFGPFVGTTSAYFASVNRGKESLTLNLKDAAERRLFERLLETADVLIENFRAGVMERLGYGWCTLQARYPKLIYAAVSGFGHSGPYAERPAYDLVVQAMGGLMSLTGHPGEPPTRVGTSIGDITAGLFVGIGINAALYHRAQTGAGTKIDVALLDCQIAILENAISRYFATGEVPGPLGSRHPSIAPFEAYATADGHIVIAAGNDALYRTLCVALGRVDLADDPRFRDNRSRSQNVLALKHELEMLLAERPGAHWISLLERAGVPCGPINDVAQAVAHPQVRARNMVIEVDDPAAGPLRMAGSPIKLSGFPDSPCRPSAPTLDQHRAAILRDLGLA